MMLLHAQQHQVDGVLRMAEDVHGQVRTAFTE